MEIKIDLSLKEIEYLKEISLGKPVEEYLESYLRFNLFHKNGINNNEKDEFENLVEKLDLYKIGQKDIAYYFDTTQPTVSRFIKSKSKKSFLYNEIFNNYETVNHFIFDLFFNVKTKIFEKSFSNKSKDWIKTILSKRSDLIPFYYSLILDIYSQLDKDFEPENANNFEIPEFIKEQIMSEIECINEEVNEEMLKQKDLHVLSIKEKYHGEIVVNIIFD